MTELVGNYPDGLGERLGVDFDHKLLFRLNPKIHRDLFKEEDIKARFDALKPGESLFAVRYLSNSLTKEGFFELATDPSVGLDELIKWQKRRVYLSKDIFPVESEFFRFDPDSWQSVSKLDRLQSDERFSRLDLRPDVSRHFLPLTLFERTSPYDGWLNVVFAWSLTQTDFHELGLTNAASLEAYAEGQGSAVGWEALKFGLADLTSKVLVNEFIEKGLLPPEGLEAFYSNSAFWLREAAVKFSFGKNLTPQGIYPYLTHELPRLDFLPYLAQNLLGYMVGIPQHLKAGQVFSPQAMHSLISEFNDFGERVVKEARVYQPEGLTGLDWIDIKSAQWYIKAMIGVKDYILRRNELWDKRTDEMYVQEEGVIPEVAGLRQEILASGGDVSKTRIGFDVKYRLQPGTE